MDVSHASAVLVFWLLGRCLYLFRYVLVSGPGLLFLVAVLVRVPLLARVVEDACFLAFWVLFVAGVRFGLTSRFVAF